jgi:hypothetical protein
VRALDRMRRLMGAGATAKEGEEDGGQSAEKER